MLVMTFSICGKQSVKHPSRQLPNNCEFAGTKQHAMGKISKLWEDGIYALTR